MSTNQNRERWSSGLLRIIALSLLLGMAALLRPALVEWVQQPWQRAILAFFVLVIILDLILAVVRISKRGITRLSRRYRRWQEARGEPNAFQTKSATSADQPVELLTSDDLGFSKYAYVLANFIADCETPMTIGIHGEWGAGKTSLSNMVRHFLSPRNKEQWLNEPQLSSIRKELQASGRNLAEELPNSLLLGLELIEFNAWQYSSAESLWRSLILTLLDRLEERGLGEDAGYWEQKLYHSINLEAKGEVRLSGTSVLIASIKAALAYFGSLLLPSTWILGGLRGSSVFPDFDDLLVRQKYTLMRKQMESIEEFQAALRHIVSLLLEQRPGDSTYERKVVIFIDDLDRCLPTVALEIMETIKSFLDVPGCVYILLCDQKLLGQGVRSKFKDLFPEGEPGSERRGREYVEKIIQVSFHIPPSSSESLKKYVERSLGNRYIEGELPYYDLVEATVANNPRKVKRLCHGLEIAYDMMQLSLGKPPSRGRITPRTRGLQTEDDPQEGSSELSRGQSTSEEDDFGASLSSADEEQAEKRTREFAKVYCLQYGWPEAMVLLREFQSQGDPQPPTRPEISDDDGAFGALSAVSASLDRLISSPDKRIFHPLLIDIDWDRARRVGSAAIRRQNDRLWRFIDMQPAFAEMSGSNLQDYIEWSGVISSDDRMSAESSVAREQPSSEDANEIELKDLKQISDEADQAEVGDPLATYRTIYSLGDDDYDDSFSIESSAGDFLGECGVAIGDLIGAGSPNKVSAFEVWLFDKNERHTVTKVLMSRYTFDDEITRDRLSAKGEPLVAKIGDVISMQTASLEVEARVVDMAYGEGSLPAESFFKRLVVELRAWGRN